MVGDVVGVDVVVGDVVVGDVVDGAAGEWLRSVFSTWSGDGIIFWLINSGLGLIMHFFSLQQRVWGNFLLLTGIMLFPFSSAAPAL